MNTPRQYKKPVVVADKASMEIEYIFESAKECADAMCIDYDYLKQVCRNNLVSKGKYVYRYASKFDEKETFEKKHNRPIKITNIVSGNEFVFYDIDFFCDMLKLDRSCLLINNINRRRVLFDFLKVEYAR